MSKQIDYNGNFGYSNVISITTGIPSEFKLLQNYPNPFNPSTKIKYYLHDKGWVSLKIYDLLGKQNAVLINEEQSPGEYEVNFSPSEYNMASSVYIYELRSGGKSAYGKMIYIK